jgi:hypothetical protein
MQEPYTQPARRFFHAQSRVGDLVGDVDVT